jgi:predicted transcriptional regulator of viral defense system
MVKINKKSAPPGPEDRAVRLVDALTGLINDRQFIMTVTDIARRAQVQKVYVRSAVEDWIAHGWIRRMRGPIGYFYLITGDAPTAPSNAGMSALGLLQTMGMADFRLGRLLYGYGSALAFHDLTGLAQTNIYVCVLDQTITPPRPRPTSSGKTQDIFHRATKTPALWGEWDGQTVFRIRRDPDNVRAYQRTNVSYQGVSLPCTSRLRTLIDCWLRPDLAGGLDRVLDAWNTFVRDPSSDQEALGREIVAFLDDSSWPSMRTAFLAWLGTEYPALASAAAHES